MVTSRPRTPQAAEEAVCLDLLVAIEGMGAEIAVPDAVLEHVVGGGWQRGGDGEDGSVGDRGSQGVVLCSSHSSRPHLHGLLPSDPGVADGARDDLCVLQG
jgi:hypothetical protein